VPVALSALLLNLRGPISGALSARALRAAAQTLNAGRRHTIRYARLAVAEPAIAEVLHIEEPAPGGGRRRVVVRWSDGSTGHALSYFADEVLVSEGDLVGKTSSELRHLHFARDREFLQRDD
jgi:hypothetical protein